MRQPTITNQRDELSIEVSAWIAGLGLFTMTALGTIALFYLLPMGTVQGDGAATLLALQENGNAFLLGGAFLFIVYVLDIVVAWALYWFLRPGQPALSQLAAWLRPLYVAFAFMGLMSAAQLYGLAHNPELIEHLGVEALEVVALGGLRVGVDPIDAQVAQEELAHEGAALPVRLPRFFGKLSALFLGGIVGGLDGHRSSPLSE